MTLEVAIFAGRALTCGLLLGLCVALARDIVSGRVER